MFRSLRLRGCPGSTSTGRRSVAESERAGWSGLLGSALAAWLAAGCIVQGGEEAERETLSWYSVGIVRFEARNQRGEIVGSGCTFDTARYREQIRFAAKEGDLVELNERFSTVAATLAAGEKYKADVDYWCGRPDTMLYHDAPDPRCWKALEPDDSVECFLEGGIAGAIESVALVPASDEPQAGKTEGFTLSIRVQRAGRQCVDIRCGEAGLRREQLAFVIERH